MTHVTPDRRNHAPWIVRRLNPLMRRLMSAGMPAGPNILLTVSGRRTGLARTFPVALMRVRDRTYIQSPYGDVDWVRNLRVAGRAMLRAHGREVPMDAVELTPEEAGPILREALLPYRRNRLVARFARIFVPLAEDATLEDHVRHVRGHPMFELAPRPGPQR
jgi:deazaflavin-dependent oxidoreductase (nitroreductase family)